MIFSQDPAVTCYDVYSVRLTRTTDSTTSPLVYGPLLPVLMEKTQQILGLSLPDNRVYSAEIIANYVSGRQSAGDGLLISKSLIDAPTS